jgi:hypothetical protein
VVESAYDRYDAPNQGACPDYGDFYGNQGYDKNPNKDKPKNYLSNSRHFHTQKIPSTVLAYIFYGIQQLTLKEYLFRLDQFFYHSLQKLSLQNTNG